MLLRRVARRTMKLVNAHFPDGLPYAEDERDFQLAASAQTRLPLADDAPPEVSVPGRRQWARRRSEVLGPRLNQWVPGRSVNMEDGFFRSACRC